VQEANLALVRAVECYNWARGGDITNYILTCMQNAVKEALLDRYLIRITRWARKQAETKGRLEALLALQPKSLERLLEESEEESVFEEIIEPAPQAQACDPAKRELVDQLLSYLTPYAQTIVRLHYGLYYDDDERSRGEAEIASLLGVRPETIHRALDYHLSRLRAYVKGEASLGQRKGRACICMDRPSGHGHVEVSEKKPMAGTLVGV
jgi:RNA polymerase sigma factor (sigma-70 family)